MKRIKPRSIRLRWRISTFLLLILSAVAVVLLVISIGYLLAHRPPDAVLPPDDAYLEPEPDAQPYPEDPTAPPTTPAQGGAASIICDSQVTVDLSRKAVALFFANPARSQQNVVVELHIREVVVAQSGRIEPGYRIDTLPLCCDEILTEGIYRGEVVVHFFDPATAEQPLSTTVPVTVTVKGAP